MLRDRGFLGAFIASCVLLVALLVLSAASIRPSDIQVPLQYTAFGITNIYRSQWYNELAFPLFALVVFVMNTLIGIRFGTEKNRQFAVAYQWLTAVILAIAFLIMLAVFRVISIVQ